MADFTSVYHIFASIYGWTVDDVDKLTFPQILSFLEQMQGDNKINDRQLRNAKNTIKQGQGALTETIKTKFGDKFFDSTEKAKPKLVRHGIMVKKTGQMIYQSDDVKKGKVSLNGR